MEVDHIFIFSNRQGQDADELISFGLIEGSNRIHPGQGTRNRKFYFKNFFLEIVWVHEESEIRSNLTAATKLWERSQHKINGCSPFGLCLDHQVDVGELFTKCLRYRPSYLAEGNSFDIITNEAYPYLPWTCRLPSFSSNTAEEPTNHPIGIEMLTTVKFEINQPNFRNEFTELLSRNSNIIFQNAPQHRLVLEFDHQRSKSIKKFSYLPLDIEY